MNKAERKALISFLSIYIGSAMLLLGILFYFYYQEEIKSLKTSCSMELKNASMKIRTDILNAYMHDKEYIPKEFNSAILRFALYDKDKKLLFSNLDEQDAVDLKKVFYEQAKQHFLIETINEAKIPIHYIVMQTCQGVRNMDNLKIYMSIAFILSSLFIGLIAFLLAKLLLKPVREKVIHMDNFIKDSAHELNTPISVLMTSVHMLKNGKNSEKMMRYILSSSKQISQIYNDIHFSAFNDIDESIDEILFLDEQIADSVEFFSDIAVTKKIQIESNLEKIKVKMDRTKAQKLVNNIISNAIKYSPLNSKIKVVLKDNIFTVQDFGIGISEEERKEIFKRYKRGKNIEGGFGIGLDIVNRICNFYSLKLDLKSKVDEGSTFSVDFSSIIFQ
ncbi:two-component sensor histidine kinase [Halarcobacter mediterraneus]|uniref:histidine kinase n=1 Tax=Halarcobacter mediterraneus TaxID=2023153 RepID=A0A4Q1B0W9_9BACT|nr:HAMP domain-containing sensor histidine kinase [Halarcobacter mediterraneus]RXK13951.1 two-component sensor histidine kinase [Halarcobacter mediterraneus]